MSFARRISNPLVLAQLRADRRFDGLVETSPAAFDVHALGEAELAKARAQARAEPDRRAPQYAIAAALYRLGRYQEALTVLDAAMAADPAYGEDPGYGSDLIVRKVTVLSELGRNDEALAITSAMCALCTRKSRFDMQQAHILIGLQRPDEALAILKHREPQSLDMAGAADLAALQACALHGVGREQDAAAKLAALQVQERAEPDAYLGALLCAGSDDQVAVALVGMLNDPQMRSTALGALQVYHEGQLPPLTKTLRARLATIAARSDVRAALARVGRIETYDMPRYAVVG
jgi:tetratricopeptide (TPR) repeat protein